MSNPLDRDIIRLSKAAKAAHAKNPPKVSREQVEHWAAVLASQKAKETKE